MHTKSEKLTARNRANSRKSTGPKTEAVGFLISDRAAWITGSNFIVDGGQNPTV